MTKAEKKLSTRTVPPSPGGNRSGHQILPSSPQLFIEGGASKKTHCVRSDIFSQMTSRNFEGFLLVNIYEFLSNQVALATFKDPPVKPKNLESLPFFLVVLACLALIFSFLPTTG